MAVECEICHLRSAEGACALCETALCETCGIACDQCGAVSCSAHTQWSKSGRALCERCARGGGPGPARPKKPGAQRHTPKNPEAPKAPEPERVAPLSFEALREEMGDLPSTTPAESAEEAPTAQRAEKSKPANKDPGAPLHRTGASYTKGLRAGATEPDPNRVLTGSGRQPTPLWLTGLFAAGIAWVLLLPLIRSADNVFHGAQPWMSYGIALLGVGTGLWCLNGLTRQEADRNERILCTIGMLLGVAASVVALWVRNPGGPA